MKGHHEKLKNGDEYDVVCARHVYCYLKKPGKTHAIKKQMSRRNRHADKIGLRREYATI